MGILEEGREKGTEETFERKMTKNFPKLMLAGHPSRKLRTPIRINANPPPHPNSG